VPLSPGDKLGPYEILAPIGAGGMGEVYRARDTRLKRDVALKVLPDTFARDPERMARFEREAELLASLNHPNIASIYGVEGRALVMEFVDGQTLPSPLSIETAIGDARQIADALEYAHERGVIHRDLKPANIKVTADGAVKLLDFGLAKSLEAHPAPSIDPDNSPTLTLGHTHVGVILGTAAYMSPEQASGSPADRRADIWSFGAVLYEMLAGKRAFQGESTSDTLATVLKIDPDWSALPADTPAVVRHLLQRCLTKNRKQRLQAIGEARILLERPDLSRDVQGAANVLAPSRSRFHYAGWISAALTTAVAAVALWGWLRPTPAPPRPIVRMSTPLAVAHVPGAIAFSPDGSRMAFVGGPTPGQIHVRIMDQIDATPLAGTTGAAFLSFSPDGQQISFLQRDPRSQLRKVSLAGGLPQTLTDVGDRIAPPTPTWAEDGHIYFSNDGVLTRIPATGGKPAIIAKPDDKTGLFGYAGPPPRPSRPMMR
jgi:serine/threonine-protein kinase